MKRSANNCVQATPDCALLFIVAQVSGAPDADRSADNKMIEGMRMKTAWFGDSEHQTPDLRRVGKNATMVS